MPFDYSETPRLLVDAFNALVADLKRLDSAGAAYDGDDGGRMYDDAVNKLHDDILRDPGVKTILAQYPQAGLTLLSVLLEAVLLQPSGNINGQVSPKICRALRCAAIAVLDLDTHCAINVSSYKHPVSMNSLLLIAAFVEGRSNLATPNCNNANDKHALLLSLLLDRGATMQQGDVNTSSILLEAAGCEHFSVLNFLGQKFGFKFLLTTCYGVQEGIVHSALGMGRTAVLSWLLHRVGDSLMRCHVVVDRDGRNVFPLAFACSGRNANAEGTRWLLENLGFESLLTEEATMIPLNATQEAANESDYNCAVLRAIMR